MSCEYSNVCATTQIAIDLWILVAANRKKTLLGFYTGGGFVRSQVRALNGCQLRGEGDYGLVIGCGQVKL